VFVQGLQNCNTVGNLGLIVQVCICAGAAGAGAGVTFDCQPGPGAPLDQGSAQCPLQVTQWQRGENEHISFSTVSASRLAARLCILVCCAVLCCVVLCKAALTTLNQSCIYHWCADSQNRTLYRELLRAVCNRLQGNTRVA